MKSVSYQTIFAKKVHHRCLTVQVRLWYVCCQILDLCLYYNCAFLTFSHKMFPHFDQINKGVFTFSERDKSIKTNFKGNTGA